MTSLSINEKLQNISIEDTTWREEATRRQSNKNWLDYSAKIAIAILSTLRRNRSNGQSPASQKDLAELLQVTPQQVNKIVKGSENLTLETIAHLEEVLGIKLINLNNDAKQDIEDMSPQPFIISEDYNTRYVSYLTVPMQECLHIETGRNYSYAMGA